MKRFIVLDSNNVVIKTRYAESIVDGEIESTEGEIGQIMQLDGTFITPELELIENTPTIEEQLLELKNISNINSANINDAIMGITELMFQEHPELLQ